MREARARNLCHSDEQEAERLGLFEEARAQSGGSKAAPRQGRQARARGFQKQTPDEGGETQGGLSDDEGGRVVVRVRAPSGPQADHPQSMQSYRREAARQGPPALRVSLPLRLRAPENRRDVYWLILPTVNAQVFSLALESFAREVEAGKRKRILLVLHRAG